MTAGAYAERVVVVSGGSRGLGAEMALGFAREGATVVVASRNQEACAEYASYLTRTTSAQAVGVACHVGRWDDCGGLIEAVLDQFGRIDVLVNNAGMSPHYPDLAQVSESLFDKVIAVNLKGPFRLGVLAAEAMGERGGAILNISSTVALAPRRDVVPYAMAKAGLNTLTSALAHAYGPRVRANGIIAGPFPTDVSAAWDMDAFERRAQSSIPLRRAGNPDEVVGAALYLCGPSATYTSGAIVKIDGGELYAPA
jgi:NAD(P)-dependent dehydrogenase (short-subunit alcohol dehydrogenase family)